MKTAKVTNIKGDDAFKVFLLAYNIRVGTIFHIDYSPQLFKLVNLSIGNRMLSLRKTDFEKIEWTYIQ